MLMDLEILRGYEMEYYIFFNKTTCRAFTAGCEFTFYYNKIKVIKRIAYGYHSFFNFRNIILIMNQLICIEKTV